MSTTYIVPSGAENRFTGRNRSSDDARNSPRAYAFFAVSRPDPSSTILKRWTRFVGESLMKTLPRTSAGYVSPRYTVGLPAPWITTDDPSGRKNGSRYPRLTPRF